jgi:hypothetical protein
MLTRKLACRNALVDVGGHDLVRRHVDAREQVEPARACGSEDEPHRAAFLT